MVYKRYLKLRKDPNKLNELINNEIRLLDRAMKKSPGLTQNTKLIRYGRFPTGKQAGDKGIFKSFTSTSYVDEGAEGFRKHNNYRIEILAPKGQKGIALGSSKQYGHGNGSEHEFLLPRNQKYRIINVNDEARIVKVLLI